MWFNGYTLLGLSIVNNDWAMLIRRIADLIDLLQISVCLICMSSMSNRPFLVNQNEFYYNWEEKMPKLFEKVIGNV